MLMANDAFLNITFYSSWTNFRLLNISHHHQLLAINLQWQNSYLSYVAHCTIMFTLLQTSHPCERCWQFDHCRYIAQIRHLYPKPPSNKMVQNQISMMTGVAAPSYSTEEMAMDIFRMAIASRMLLPNHFPQACFSLESFWFTNAAVASRHFL